MMYVRFPLSLRNVEDLLRELGIESRPNTFVTDKLRSYGAAMKEIGNVEKQETGRWLNNRAENSHRPRLSPQPFQRGAPSLFTQ
jgi:transposase-like protein